jgi:flagellar hook-basal body complex protein FliE
MDFLTPKEAIGHTLALKTSHPLHRSGTKGPAEPGSGNTFGNMLIEGLNDVNSRQQEGMNLMQQMVIDPESVDTHDVTIALAQANLSLSITKEVVERAVKAYREIISIR